MDGSLSQVPNKSNGVLQCERTLEAVRRRELNAWYLDINTSRTTNLALKKGFW